MEIVISLTAFVLCGFGRRIAGGCFQDLTGLDIGDLPVRLFFGLTVALAALMAGVTFWWAVALIPITWVGTTTGNFDGTSMGRDTRPYWRDFAGMTLHGVLSIILPTVWAWYFGFALWPIILSGFLIGPCYEAGYRLFPFVPGHAYSRPTWIKGFAAATEWGEIFWGGFIGLGTVLAIFLA
jgi:hypothetical protein